MFAEASRTVAVSVSRADRGGKEGGGVKEEGRQTVRQDGDGDRGRGARVLLKPRRPGRSAQGHNDTVQWRNESTGRRCLLVMFHMILCGAFFTLEHKLTGSALLHYHHLINQRNSRVFHLQFKTGRNSI